MREMGLFKLWQPKYLGGAEIDLHTALEITEQLARFDGSTAWNFMIGLQSSALLGFMPEHVVREMMADEPMATLGGSGQPGGIAVPVEGGYRITGRWAFTSGSNHTRWICGNCRIDDGSEPNPEAPPDLRMFWFRSDQYEVLDTWYTMGLRASGSHDFEVKDVFVPADRFVSGMLTKSPYQTGTIYQTRVVLLLLPTFASVAIGIAREALDEFVKLAQKKKPTRATRLLAEYDSIAQTIGRAEAKINAAHDYLHGAMCERLWSAMKAGNGDDEALAVDVFYAGAFACQMANEAVEVLQDAAGGTGIYESSPLERCFRDVHMVSKHAGGSAQTNYTRGGNFRLGNGFSLAR
ncbi:MAG: acyl-CoA dehydrogenase family protein, partial [Dehalococcoidia bacterium]